MTPDKRTQKRQLIQTELDRVESALDKLQHKIITAEADEILPLGRERDKLTRDHQTLLASIAIIDHDIAMQAVEEKHHAELAERQRKEQLKAFLIKQPPRCAGCKRADKMATSVDTFGRPIPGLDAMEFRTGNITTPNADWRLRFRCGHHNCPIGGLGQLVYPDKERAFQDGEVDKSFPVRLKEGLTK